MGAIADAISRFAQPLLDAADGSPQEIQRALSLGQLCWNLALMPEDSREQSLADMQPTLKMNDADFQELKRDLIMPMIRRHHAMFPNMQRLGTGDPHAALGEPARSPSVQIHPPKPYAGTGRNARCPCGSGRKYKVCCGQ
ncbi:SEC-C metal-binding domain-containing protein [Thiocystis violacea]|uniref:SEC-C metal-binding domain-containing protein n=1 Tax=Thiocystis violacea TaxID=13725 RepID=UPI001908A107|nr:SEC-C metal-binding domain-containing protein [Thiocystis violacea]MBK1725279.1 hypothetical protein [Thiocystis violacea]